MNACEATADTDHDGANAAECGGTDCDDSDPLRFPGAPEVCDPDGHDEDCDPLTIAAKPNLKSQSNLGGTNGDVDGDGYINVQCSNQASYPNQSAFGTDCNDLNADVHPGQAEVCNGIDDNCDGQVDEGVAVTLARDYDGDGHGDPQTTITGCPGTPGYSVLGEDCDDTNPAIVAGSIICDSGNVDPGAAWVCSSDNPGTYTETHCFSGQQCVTQPNSLGVCVPNSGFVPGDTILVP